jgi:hypothetical protein
MDTKISIFNVENCKARYVYWIEAGHKNGIKKEEKRILRMKIV